MYYVQTPTLEYRQALIQYLKSKGILTVFHYLPLHLSDMGLKFGGKVGDCPNTERISDQLLRLPFYHTLSEANQQQVVEAIYSFKGP